MKFTRMLLAALACAVSLAAQAQTARMLAGYPPGGAVDGVARLFADKLSEGIGRPVVVENRVGALGQLAATELRKSAPDGNTLLVSTDSGLTLWPHTVKAPPYDTMRDFVPVAHVGSYDSALAVGPGAPVKDLREWIAFVKSNPKNAVYGSPGAGSNQHFLGFMLGQAIGVPLTHVAYRGVQPTVADLISGQIPAVVLPYAQLLPHIKTGKVRILAHSGGQRAPLQPDVPTFKELGYPTLEVSGWYLIVAPAGTPEDVVRRYHAIFAQAMRTPAVRDRMRALDLDIREITPAEMQIKLKTEYDRWRPIVEASGFRAENQ
jgi:tripartite-type tricarboxylate transporter receptor subunit TctC